MYSLSVRFNTITFYTMILLAVLSAGNYYTARIFEKEFLPTDASISVQKIVYLQELFNTQIFKQTFAKLHSYFSKENKLQGWDEITFNLNINATLSLLNTWNLKQLYLYVEAVYDDPVTHLRSRAVVWDKIVKRQYLSNFNGVEKQMIKYKLRDIYRSLRGKTIELRLRAEIMPIVGLMHLKTLTTEKFTLPTEYTSQYIYCIYKMNLKSNLNYFEHCTKQYVETIFVLYVKMQIKKNQAVCGRKHQDFFLLVLQNFKDVGDDIGKHMEYLKKKKSKPKVK